MLKISLIFAVFLLISHVNADDIPTDPDWSSLHAAGHLTYSKTLANLMPFIGNGYLATHPVSKNADQMNNLFVSGVFNGAAVFGNCTSPPTGCKSPHRAVIPKYKITLSSTGTARADGGYALDMQRAILFHRWIDHSGMNVEERWYAHQTRRSLLVHEIQLMNPKNATSNVSIGQLIVSDQGTSVDINFSPCGTNGLAVDNVCISGKVKNRELPTLDFTEVARVSNKPPDSPLSPLKPGELRTLYFINALATSIESTHDPASQAMKDLNSGIKDAENLLTEHVKAWQARWDQGRIEVGGNLPLAQAINASMYFILSSIRSDWAQGLSPGGLASNGYSGHSFWDCETWMYPPLLMLHPDLARSALQYRLDRRHSAAAIAKRNGYGGYEFPWESAFSGEEVQGTSWGKIGRWGKYELHISGDIAYAAYQYWSASGNVSWLATDLEPLLRGIADFWVSRVTHGVDNKYHILSVMPPDEYHYPVDDSIVTNVVARITLQAASEAAKVLGRPIGSNWSDIVKNMFIPFDEQKQIHPEFAAYKGDKVKQGDVILLGWPYIFNMSAKVRRNDLRYYAPLTAQNGPAMTWAMFAIGWLDGDDIDMANKQFLKGYANQQQPFQVWTETPRGGTVNFITGAGGFLQSLVFGFGGLRLEHDRLLLNVPAPPTGTAEVKLRGVHYHGNRLEIISHSNTVQILVLSRETTGAHLQLIDVSGTSPPQNLLPGAEPIMISHSKQYYICTSESQR